MAKKKIEKEKIKKPKEVVLTSGKEKIKLRHELFCKLYAGTTEFFGNGTQAYLEASRKFKLAGEKRITYETARASASRLLTNVNILKRIDKELEKTLGEIGLNDQFVDKELLFCITQKADLKTKVIAIREYNALKQRVTKKIKLGNLDDNTFKIDISVIDSKQKEQ